MPAFCTTLSGYSGCKKTHIKSKLYFRNTSNKIRLKQKPEKQNESKQTNLSKLNFMSSTKSEGFSDDAIFTQDFKVNNKLTLIKTITAVNEFNQAIMKLCYCSDHSRRVERNYGLEYAFKNFPANFDYLTESS